MNLYRYSQNNALVFRDILGNECRYFEDNSLNVRWSCPILIGVIPQVDAAIATNPEIVSTQPAKFLIGIPFRAIAVWEHCDVIGIDWSGLCPIPTKKLDIRTKEMIEYRMVQ
ncbi:MAG: hypothetical protein Q4D62_07805 [Planctomycetia bacterium]|nr:hypothetical protein [Planctomycetia bacterium]